MKILYLGWIGAKNVGDDLMFNIFKLTLFNIFTIFNIYGIIDIFY